MTTQEAPMPIEDLVGLPLAGGGEIVTRVTPDDRAEAMTRAWHFDTGYRAGQFSVRLDAQNQIRAERSRVWAEAEAEYVKHRRRFAFTFLAVVAILIVMGAALLYLSGSQS